MYPPRILKGILFVCRYISGSDTALSSLLVVYLINFLNSDFLIFRNSLKVQVFLSTVPHIKSLISRNLTSKVNCFSQVPPCYTINTERWSVKSTYVASLYRKLRSPSYCGIYNLLLYQRLCSNCYCGRVGFLNHHFPYLNLSKKNDTWLFFFLLLQLYVCA